MGYTCVNHPRTPARWGCPACKTTVCNECKKVKAFALGSLEVCPSCGEALQPIDASEADVAASAPGSILRAFIYPFESDPIMTVVAAAVFCGGLSWVFSFIPFGGLVQGFLFLMVLSYGETVVRHTMQGRQGAPDWAEISSVWDVLPPFLRLVGVMAIAFGPALALAFYVDASAWAVSLAAIVGAIYAPMAWLAVSATGSVLGMSPHIVFPAIARVGIDYWLAVPVLPVAGSLWFTLSTVFRTAGGRLFGSLLGYAVMMIALLAIGRLVGLIYLRNEDALEW